MVSPNNATVYVANYYDGSGKRCPTQPPPPWRQTGPNSGFYSYLVVYNTVTQKEESDISLGQISTVFGSAMTPDSQYLYFINQDYLRMFSVATNTIAASISFFSASAIAIAPSGNYAYIVSSNGDVGTGYLTVFNIGPN